MLNRTLKHIATALGAATVLCAFSAVAQDSTDSATSRRVSGQENAKGASIVINQIDTSAYPKVTVFATVLKDGAPLRGLTAADFKVREDEVEQEPLTVVPKLSPLSAIVALDVSGSMKKRLPDAQAAAQSFIDTLGPDDKVQVLSFAREVKLLGNGDERDSARAAINQTVARGDTALYDALYTSVESLKDKPGRKAITLLSDGADDDGTGKQLSKHSVNDVLALARVVNVPIFTIGVGTEIDEAILKNVAEQTGAMYLLAPQPSELKKLYETISEQLAGQYNIYYTSNLPGDGSVHRVQLKHENMTGTKEYTSPKIAAAAAAPKVVAATTPALTPDVTPSPTPEVTPSPTPEESLLVDKTKKPKLQGEAIKGGNDYDEAVPLKPGQLYHLSHHQRANEYDYFVVDLKSGEKLIASVTTTENGVTISDDNKTVPNDSPGAGISIRNAKHEELSSAICRGRNEKKTVWHIGADGKEGKIYVLLGDQYPQSLDTKFQVDVLKWGDAKSGRDAGDTEEQAVEISPGLYPENHLTPAHDFDIADTFKFKAKAGTVYQLKLRPSGEKAQLAMQKMWDSEGVDVTDSQTAPNPGAVLTVDKITAKKDGYIFFKITAQSDDDLAYSMALAENSVEAPPKPTPVPALSE